ncbi:MAG: AAA family ATPase [Verrucomicrobia bacterium]|nr:AAA family ATPase [Verrucomicrobiota bacterium]
MDNDPSKPNPNQAPPEPAYPAQHLAPQYYGGGSPVAPPMGSSGYYPGLAGYNYVPYSNYGYSGYGYGDQASEFLSPRRLLKVVRRRWFLILLLTLFGAAGAFLYFWKVERVYQATALIEMSVRPPRVLSDVVRQEMGRSEEVFNTRLGRLRGERFRLIAAEQFALLWDARGTPTAHADRPRFASLSYNMMRSSRLVQFQARASDPTVAAISANAAAEAAEAFFQEENRAMSDAAVEYLNRQASIQKDQLTRTEDALLAFRRENQLDALQAQQEADRQSLYSLNANKVQTEGELLRTRELLDTITDITVDLDAGVEIPITLPNRERITRSLQQYRGAQAERLLMLERFTEQHPSVQELDFRLKELAEDIRMEISSAQRTFQQQIRIIEGQLRAVMAEIAKLQETVSRQELVIVERTSRLNAMTRERNAAEMAYQSVLNRIEDARMAADEDTATLKVVEYATRPDNPVHPRLALILPVGVFGGLALGFLLALGAEAMEDRIFSIAELEASISSRIIGIIPHITGGKRADLAMISLNQKFGQVAESFNAVRVLLDHINQTRIRKVLKEGHHHPGAHVVMFCSASPSEGKTVSATNIAITSARGGQKTLLIDCDMRRPRLAKVFEEALADREGNAEDYSLLHHLSTVGGKDFEKIIMPGPTDHLDLIASLSSTEINPADLLGGDKMPKLIAWARENYDRVIIDTPPIGIISDGLVIAGLSDGVVVVCRTAQTRHRALRHVLLQFKGVGCSVLGIIVNDFNMKKVSEPLDVHYKDFSSTYKQAGYSEQTKIKE